MSQYDKLGIGIVVVALGATLFGLLGWGEAAAQEKGEARYILECGPDVCLRMEETTGASWVLAGVGPATWRWTEVMEPIPLEPWPPDPEPGE